MLTSKTNLVAVTALVLGCAGFALIGQASASNPTGKKPAVRLAVYATAPGAASPVPVSNVHWRRPYRAYYAPRPYPYYAYRPYPVYRPYRAYYGPVVPYPAYSTFYYGTPTFNFSVGGPGYYGGWYW